MQIVRSARGPRTARKSQWALLAAVIVATLVLSAPRVLGQDGRLTVSVNRPGVKISPMLYGLMTEEINHSYDGGLYAELIQNRAFMDHQVEPVHWSLIQEGAGEGAMALDSTQPINPALPICLKVIVSTAAPAHRVAVANDGYWGIPVRSNSPYRCSFYAKAADGFRGEINVSIETNDGSKTYAQSRIRGITDIWRRYTVTLTTGNVLPSTQNRLVISPEGLGVVYLNLVSLFPTTFHGRQNGTRPDLMRLLRDLKPAFLRFPGGNYLEGTTVAERFDWKKSIGPLGQRPGHRGPWGYRSSDGFGLMEFVNWCDDLNMGPILAVFAGYALSGDLVPAGPRLEPFVQDALDEIEYLTGDASTQWGAQRIQDGHPSPVKLTYVEIGNEDGFDRHGTYDERFAQFYDAIKATYPALKLIATAPVRSRRSDMIDDHYYRSAADMERDVHHYDRADRKGPKIFVGEWASTEGTPTPTLQAALGDAAWLTGLERNSDLVLISCYAPLLVNVNPGARQWGTNLIGYDALNSFGSPSYYSQAMFAKNRGDVVLPVAIVPQTVPAPEAFVPAGAVGVGTWATQAEYRDLTMIRGAEVYGPEVKPWLDRFLHPSQFPGAWRSYVGPQGIHLTQDSESADCRFVIGDPKWTDYSFRLKARKLGGAEGFLVLFHVQDKGNFLWWNIGGWGNTRTAIERSTDGAKRDVGNAVPMAIETGRWYDIRVEVAGRRIRCYLDDKLITEAIDGPSHLDPLYATASRDIASGDVIVKVVNVTAAPQALQVDLQGLKSVHGGTAQVLQGAPGDINTLEEPRRIAPRSMPLTTLSPQFAHTFPPYSVSVLRVRTR